MDAVPRRLNSINIFLSRPGLFYRQCSEICGIGHAFMPIIIRGMMGDPNAYYQDIYATSIDKFEEENLIRLNKCTGNSCHHIILSNNYLISIMLQ